MLYVVYVRTLLIAFADITTIPASFLSAITLLGRSYDVPTSRERERGILALEMREGAALAARGVQHKQQTAACRIKS